MALIRCEQCGQLTQENDFVGEVCGWCADDNGRPNLVAQNPSQSQEESLFDADD